MKILKLGVFPLLVFSLFAFSSFTKLHKETHNKMIHSPQSTVSQDFTFTGNSSISGTISAQYGTTGVYTNLGVNVTGYGNLENLTSISHGTTPGGPGGTIYDDKYEATSADGVYYVKFVIYGQFGGPWYINVLETEYTP